MSIEALYPSRRYPQQNNPLLRRAPRRHGLIVALALVACGLGMVLLRISPTPASAAGHIRPALQTAPFVSVHHIRVIPLYHVPPEQAGALAHRG